MTLIKCSECGSNVSEKAESCPHCGNPIASCKPESIQTISRIDTIERTKKKWKAWILMGVILMIIGLPMFVFNFIGGIFATINGNNSNEILLVIGFFSSAMGFISFLVGSVGAWWNHG